MATDNKQFDAARVAMMATSNTPGWAYIKQLANNRVQKAVQEALDAEDKEKGEFLRIKAKAMQQGFTDFFVMIEAVRNWQPDRDEFFEQLERELENGTDR